MEKNNKLIAEFMDLTIKEGVCYYTDSDDMFPMDIEVEAPYIPYDDDWNWLKVVVDEIKMRCEGVPQQLLHLSLFSHQNEVYNAVVEFIKFYNLKERKDDRQGN